MSPNDNQDAITEEEIAGTVPQSSVASPSRNAFTALMSTKQKASSSQRGATKKLYSDNSLLGRNGLGAYIVEPSKYDSSRVIYHNADFVAINDLYPKSSVHTLLLPRSSKHNLLHPFEALEDPEFLAAVKEQVKKLRRLVASELRRRYGQYSKQEAPREAVLRGEVDLADADELPVGRDWERSIRDGVHAHPSMNHLHVHVMSVDRYSDALNHKKHYNSFATPFFVPIDDFPLAKDDVRRHPGRQGYLNSDLKCWRCGKNYGRQFAKLKAHLAEEYEAWRRE